MLRASCGSNKEIHDINRGNQEQVRGRKNPAAAESRNRQEVGTGRRVQDRSSEPEVTNQEYRAEVRVRIKCQSQFRGVPGRPGAQQSSLLLRQFVVICSGLLS